MQDVELATARRGDYTIDELIDFPGACYEELTGEAEIRPGIWILPTPEHADGHQSLVVRRGDGTVILAGQAYDRASDFAADHLARHAAPDAPGRAGPPKHGSIRLLGYAPPQEVQQRCTRDGTYEQVAPWRISCWSWCSRSASS